MTRLELKSKSNSIYIFNYSRHCILEYHPWSTNFILHYNSEYSNNRNYHVLSYLLFRIITCDHAMVFHKSGVFYVLSIMRSKLDCIINKTLTVTLTQGEFWINRVLFRIWHSDKLSILGHRLFHHCWSLELIALSYAYFLDFWGRLYANWYLKLTSLPPHPMVVLDFLPTVLPQDQEVHPSF